LREIDKEKMREESWGALTAWSLADGVSRARSLIELMEV
jgi:hypothetical protein